MSTLKLHGHPLAAYCWKALIALYDAGVPFEFEVVNLQDPEVAARYRTLSPFGKMPALEDGGVTLFESTIVIEHLARNQPPAARLLPQDWPAAREVRLWDRLFDFYVMNNVQKIVGDRMRPAGGRDRLGTDQARAEMRTAYAQIEQRMAGREWVAGDFSLADCAAAPALYYAQKVEPFVADHPNAAAYYERLCARPAIARVLQEAEPFLHFFPEEPAAA
jgi:glutathione S-transferase